MSIDPIIHRVTVKPAPARAFDLFTAHIGNWWPKGQTPGKSPQAVVIVEPHAGGKWFERDMEGNETQWGKVLEWEPPGRLVLGWQLNTQWRYDPALLTEVELTFTHAENGGTVVTLEHRNLERFGADAGMFIASITTGWPARVADFVRYADAQS